MAVYDLEEQEQIDELKAWWARYGGAVTVGLVLALLLVAGVQGWRWWAGKRAEDASVLYTAVSDAVRAKDAAKGKDAAVQLTERYAGTGYAPRGALLFGKLLYDSGDREGKRHIAGGRKKLRNVLYMPVVAAIRCNPVLAAYYKRLLACGKEPKVALVACMRKLLVIVTAMIINQQDWAPHSGAQTAAA